VPSRARRLCPPWAGVVTDLHPPEVLADFGRIEGLLSSHGQDANGSQSTSGPTRTGAAGTDPLTTLVSHRRLIDRLFGDFDGGSPN
jgi:hypothetical protein